MIVRGRPHLGNRPAEQRGPSRGHGKPDESAHRHQTGTLSHRRRPRPTLPRSMTERRILETTQLLGALPAGSARDPPLQVDPARRRPQRGALPPGRRGQRALRHRVGPGRHPHQVARRPRVAGGGARGGRAVRRALAVRRGAALGRRPGARGHPAARARPRRGARRDRGAAAAPLGDRAHVRAPPARHRRLARRRGVPRRPRAHRQAAARDRGRRRRSSACR